MILSSDGPFQMVCNFSLLVRPSLPCVNPNPMFRRLLSLQDLDKPCDTFLQQVSIEEILEEQRLEQQAKQETEKVKLQALKDRGLSIPKADNLDEY